MRDVSVRVGGANQTLFPAPANTSGDIDTSQASIVTIENFSPWVFQFGNDAIPPMWRRTFAIDNYPVVHWTIVGNKNILYTGISPGIGELRLVRILLDPSFATNDGPVYPNPVPISGGWSVGQTPDANTGGFIISARDLLLLGGGDLGQGDGNSFGAYQFGDQARDMAIVAFELNAPGDLVPNVAKLVAYNIDKSANSEIGGYNFWQDINQKYLGKDVNVFRELPGPSCVGIHLAAAFGSPIGFGEITFTAWCGYHL